MMNRNYLPAIFFCHILLLFPNSVGASCSGLEGKDHSDCQAADREMRVQVFERESERRNELVEFDCAGKTISVARGELRDFNNVIKTLFDEIAVCNYWKGSGLCLTKGFSISCADGKANGLFKAFYPSGSSKSEINFVNNTLKDRKSFTESGALETSIRIFPRDRGVGCSWKAGALVKRWEFWGEKSHGYFMESLYGKTTELFYNKGQRIDLPTDGKNFNKSCEEIS